MERSVSGALNRLTTKGAPVVTGKAPGNATPLLLLAANSNRRTATFFNNGTTTVFIGGADVTPTTGLPVPSKQSMIDNSTTAAWYGITASGTGDIRVVEVA